MCHIFPKGDRRTSNLVQGRCTMTRIADMRGDLKGQRSRSPGRSGLQFISQLAGSRAYFGCKRPQNLL